MKFLVTDTAGCRCILLTAQQLQAGREPTVLATLPKGYREAIPQEPYFIDGTAPAQYQGFATYNEVRPL